MRTGPKSGPRPAVNTRVVDQAEREMREPRRFEVDLKTYREGIRAQSKEALDLCRELHVPIPERSR